MRADSGVLGSARCFWHPAPRRQAPSKSRRGITWDPPLLISHKEVEKSCLFSDLSDETDGASTAASMVAMPDARSLMQELSGTADSLQKRPQVLTRRSIEYYNSE